MNELVHKPKAMSKNDLVTLYYAGISISQSFVSRFFSNEIHSKPELMAKLEAVGYCKDNKILSVNQVQVIFDHLTPPVKVEDTKK